MEEKDMPLVSVPVITYNSAKFVLETLESIKAQTYQNIELIISDDCSTDNTVELCQKWIDENKKRFVRTQIITSKVNTGVSGNGNRGREVCRGEWIKGIAGDDLLTPECIEKFMIYINSNQEADFVFSRVEPFGANKSIVDMYKNTNVFDYSFFSKTTEGQLDALVIDDKHIPAPSLFYRRGVLEKYNIKNDERLPLIEDEPLWINILRAGIHLYFLNDVTVKYRVGDINALSSPIHIMSPLQFESICRFYFYYKFPARYQNNPNKAIEQMVELLIDLYTKAYIKDKKKNKFSKYNSVLIWINKQLRYMKNKAKKFLKEM